MNIERLTQELETFKRALEEKKKAFVQANAQALYYQTEVNRIANDMWLLKAKFEKETQRSDLYFKKLVMVANGEISMDDLRKFLSDKKPNLRIGG